ncbi:Aldo/keto reductase [Lentinula aff. detonsa]|uniref:Aldo/keto reductase n=1 Tax=Lentinula aff. detonsa TaxID=2804958 RepID=A0AA38NU96_9AGAR|nr:Aldo/keto reductase [Lentinula aff. detonsa]
MTSNTQKTELNVVMGSATFGEEGQPGARIHDLDKIEALLDIFRAHGHTDIDSAYFYAGGTSEVVLGKIDWKSKGLKLETKLPAIFNEQQKTVHGTEETVSHTYKVQRSLLGWPLGADYLWNEQDIKIHILKSLKALDTEQLDIFYLHTPDRLTPYEVTMKAVNDLYREGYFKRFGISNYTSWEVAELVGICKANGYVLPSVYQGLYNAVHRAVEPELIPCLRKFGISFYGFNPLGGGLFTGRYTSPEDDVGEGTRFDPNGVQGKLYRKRYWNDHYFEAMSSIRTAADAHELTMAEVALRWLCHHSVLKRDFGDSIIIGASSLDHVKQNLVDLEKGPLPAEVIDALDKGWEIVRPYASPYYH